MESQDRYSRQVRFQHFGEAAQARLRDSSALLVGAGALGTWLASMLVRAGLGRLTIVDRDVVVLSNLQRQLMFTEADVDRPKAVAAAEHLRAANHEVEVTPVAEEFTPRTFAELPQPPDLILDGTDNFATRYLLNDLAAKHGIPWIYGGVVGAHGTAMVVLPGEAPCLRCIMPEPPATGETDTCETAGVLAPAVAALTAFQAAEALKILAGLDDAVTRGIVVLDTWNHRHDLRMTEAKPSPACPACAHQEYPALGADWSGAVSLCGRDAIQVQPRTGADLDLRNLAANLEGAVESPQLTPDLLRFRAEGCRFSVFPGGRALLFGAGDVDRARILYDRYVGA